MKSKIIDKILANTPQDVHDSADLFAKEIAAAEKIILIQKSIEDKTGFRVEVSEDAGTWLFTMRNNKDCYTGSYSIDNDLLEMLPISDPLEEQPDKEWIPDIIKLEDERLAWSLETFKEATPISSLRKCEAEILEIEQDINAGIQEPMEYADALMCLFDSAGRQGIKVVDIFKAFESKLARNKARTWTKNPDNTYSHVPQPPIK